MKYSDLPVKNFSELNDKCYLICSEITTKEDNEVQSVDKFMLNVSELANRSDLITLSEQNAHLVEVINKLINNYNLLENQVRELSNNKPTIDFSEVNDKIKDLKERLDRNLVEL